MRRALVAMTTLALTLVAGPAWACAGLVAPNGAVQLVRTTTLSAYHDGVEHYVTSFEFSKAKGEFGSIVPLPGVPTKIAKAGQWTLQRLQQEVQPVLEGVQFLAAGAAADAARAVVLEEKRVGALDLTILKGGGSAVARWAEGHGFSLTPDAPEVLDFYGARSPIFMAVKFDATRAARQGLEVGDGTPVHLTIPTDDPWVPLRILGLGADRSDVIEADVFLLTEREPAMLPAPVAGVGADTGVKGLRLERSEPASKLLLTDLKGDRGMRWLPTSGMWLTYLELDERAADLTYDLALDVTGRSDPSPVDAGLASPRTSTPVDLLPLWITAALLAGLGVVALVERRRASAAL
jgi:Uncharacterized protein conserved in bacteria (DUF2330)